MSLQAPLTAIQRPKAYFHFYSPLQTVFDSPKVSDTTSVSTLSTNRTTAKTYTLSIPTGANTIRVIVYGYVTGATGYYILSIDGADVQTATTTSTSEVMVIDYIGTVSPGTRTIRIDYYISATGSTVNLTKVYIATGIGVTMTTLSDVITFSVTYQLVRIGDIRYSPGVRLFIYGNRKTTAPARLEVGSSPVTGRNQLGAGNDNDKAETFLAIVTGSVTLQEGGEFTLSVTLRGKVGATGDTVIITRVLARAQLRRSLWNEGEVRIYERGITEYAGRARVISVPDGAINTQHQIILNDLQNEVLLVHNISGTGTDIILLNFKVAVVTPVHFMALWASADSYGETFLEWVQVVVLG